MLALHTLDNTLQQSNALVKNLLIKSSFHPPKEFFPTYSHPSPDSGAPVNTSGLNYLKIIGRTDTVTNYVTHRQQLGAFSTTFNSSRYEVTSTPVSVTLIIFSPTSFLSTLNVLIPLLSTIRRHTQ
jgi:hypothetical protein